MSIKASNDIQLKLYIYFPLVLTLLLIFYFSSMSQLPFEPIFSLQDKLHHFIAFFTLGYCLLRICTFKQWSKSLTVVVVVLFGTIYGLVDEIHQLYVPNRQFDWFDLVADFLGCVTALWLGSPLLKLDHFIKQRLVH